MEFLFIWILIIGLVIRGELKKQKRNRTNRPMGQPMQRYQKQTQEMQQYQKSTQEMQQYQKQMQEMQQYQKQMQEIQQYRKQQELKKRLQQRYGTVQNVSGTQVKSAGKPQNTAGRTSSHSAEKGGGMQGDILSRAAANVGEYEKDQLEMPAASSEPSGMQKMQNSMETYQQMDSELMREVRDLMIMGYQAELTFERDFVAEGIELLNAYDLQTD